MRKSLLCLSALACLSAGLRAAERPIVIDKEHSRIEAEAKATMHAFTAKVVSYEADFLVDPAVGKVKRGTLRFKVSNVRTGDEKRDRDMLVWEQSDQFPEVVFTLIAIEDQSTGKAVARGQLILHGVAKEIVVPATIETKDQRVFTIAGQYDLDTREYGLAVIRKYGLLKVDPLLRVSFHLQGSVTE